MCITIAILPWNVLAQEPPAAEQQIEPNDQSGEFRYISDDLFTYMRAGPGPGYRLLGSVNAGSKIQLLQVDRTAGYAEIIDQRQRSGWVEIRYVSRSPSVREELSQVSQKLAQKELKLTQMQNEVDAVMANLTVSEKQRNDLNRQVTRQLEEIGVLKERLEQGLRSNQMQWFSNGAILAVVSVFIGYLMGLFGRKNKKDRLM